MGHEAEHMRHMVRNEQKLFTVYERIKRELHHQRAERTDGATILNYFNSKNLHIAEGCVCANPKQDANTRLLQTKQTMQKQFIQFRKMVLPGTQPYKSSTFVFTGKAKSGMQDDLVMTTMIAIFWGQQFLERRIDNIPYDELYDN